jgi:hypothetical protein
MGEFVSMTDASMYLRFLMANVIADAGTARTIVSGLPSAGDREYLGRELDRLQSAAHRIVALLDEVPLECDRQ